MLQIDLSTYACCVAERRAGECENGARIEKKEEGFLQVSRRKASEIGLFKGMWFT